MEKFNYKGKKVYLCVINNFDSRRPRVKAIPVRWFEDNNINDLIAGFDGIDGDLLPDELAEELNKFETVDTTFFTFT